MSALTVRAMQVQLQRFLNSKGNGWKTIQIYVIGLRVMVQHRSRPIRIVAASFGSMSHPTQVTRPMNTIAGLVPMSGFVGVNLSFSEMNAHSIRMGPFVVG